MLVSFSIWTNCRFKWSVCIIIHGKCIVNKCGSVYDGRASCWLSWNTFCAGWFTWRLVAWDAPVAHVHCQTLDWFLARHARRNGFPFPSMNHHKSPFCLRGGSCRGEMRWDEMGYVRQIGWMDGWMLRGGAAHSRPSCKASLSRGALVSIRWNIELNYTILSTT